jgi:hypothetical protein
MLVAALNHSYTTNVFKEEILTDITKERACDTPHSKRENGEGTGDMPEAWGSANAVNLLRDMLVQERYPAPGEAGEATLHLLAGLPADWIVPGQDIWVSNTPTTLGTTVSVRVHPVGGSGMEITADVGNRPSDLVVHIPVNSVREIKMVRVDGKLMPSSLLVSIPRVTGQVTVEVELSK